VNRCGHSRATGRATAVNPVLPWTTTGMIKIVVTDPDNQVHHLDVDPGLSLMAAVTRSGIRGMDAICGGACACATCRVNVDEAWISRLPPANENEASLLEYSGFETPEIRLSCQITLTDALSGIKVSIPSAG
jgi:2Fe-2S ferredoxin